jgi:hypothetical protein
MRLQDMIYIILQYTPLNEIYLNSKLVQTHIILCLIFIK